MASHELGPASHFRSVPLLNSLLEEILARHAGGPVPLVEAAIAEVRSYWERIPGPATGGPPPLVLGLSGGVDSTVVAFLAARAAGSRNVRALTILARRDDSESARSAQLARQWLGIKDCDGPTVIDVSSVVERLIETINDLAFPELQIAATDSDRSNGQRIRAGNLASRMRVSLFYDVASACGGRVLGTSNRTEFLLGYAAKFGTPMSYDMGVLDDLYKVEVRQVAEAIGVPAQIRLRPSSTGYYAGQTHEGELGGRYDELDAACYLLAEKSLGIGEAADRYQVDPAFLGMVARRMVSATHKRALKPPSIDLTPTGV